MISEYLKKLQPILKTETSKCTNAKTIKFLTNRFTEETKQVRNSRLNAKIVEDKEIL